eukprot:3053367-Heterocapsa_arctica.AAC.1
MSSTRVSACPESQAFAPLNNHFCRKRETDHNHDFKILVNMLSGGCGMLRVSDVEQAEPVGE